MTALWLGLLRKVIREERADTHRAVDPCPLGRSRQVDGLIDVQAVREHDVLRGRINAELSVEVDGNVDKLEWVA